jgi:hypothetical protein
MIWLKSIMIVWRRSISLDKVGAHRLLQEVYDMSIHASPPHPLKITLL